MCPTLCNPMEYSTPGFPVLHHLPEFVQTHVCWLSDATQPSHPLSPPSPPALNLSQHLGLFQWVSSLDQVAKVLQFQHLSFQSVFRVDFLCDWLVWSPCSPRHTQESLLQHHSWKVLVPRHSAFLMVQLSYPYMTTGKNIVLTIWTSLSCKMLSLLF